MTPRPIVLCEVCGAEITGTISQRRRRCTSHRLEPEEVDDPAPQPEQGHDYEPTYTWRLYFSGTISGSTTYEGDSDGLPTTAESRDAIMLEAVQNEKFEVQDWFITDTSRGKVRRPHVRLDGQDFDAGQWLEAQGWSPPEGAVRPGERERPGTEETLGAWSA